MKNIAILGSTGSIGTQTLDVVRKNLKDFHISVLAAHSSDEQMEKQMQEFSPEIAVLSDAEAAKRLKKRYRGKTKILGGVEGLLEGAVYPDVHTVVTSLTGFVGLAPTLAALHAGKNIALANKETLVVAGELVMRLAEEKGVSILPVDSEHCALFQCLAGEDRDTIEKLILTASGGPFRGKKTEELKEVSVKDCLNHPTWAMGKKITVDSATLVNKGLEVIEAHWLYDVPYEKIEVVVHPQSIVHSMVAYHDGSVMAQLGMPDMRIPIQYALTYPKRLHSTLPRLDFHTIRELTFESPDMETFRGLKLAYEAGRIGGTMPCILNGANEEAVAAFLSGRIGFLEIYNLIESAMNTREVKFSPTYEVYCAEDAWVRDFVKGQIAKKE